MSENFEQALADYWKRSDTLANQLGVALDNARRERERADKWKAVAERLDTEMKAVRWTMTAGQADLKKLEQEERKHDSETVS